MPGGMPVLLLALRWVISPAATAKVEPTTPLSRATTTTRLVSPTACRATSRRASRPEPTGPVARTSPSAAPASRAVPRQLAASTSRMPVNPLPCRVPTSAKAHRAAPATAITRAERARRRLLRRRCSTGRAASTSTTKAAVSAPIQRGGPHHRNGGSGASPSASTVVRTTAVAARAPSHATTSTTPVASPAASTVALCRSLVGSPTRRNGRVVRRTARSRSPPVARAPIQTARTAGSRRSSQARPLKAVAWARTSAAVWDGSSSPDSTWRSSLVTAPAGSELLQKTSR